MPRNPILIINSCSRLLSACFRRSKPICGISTALVDGCFVGVGISGIVLSPGSFYIYKRNTQGFLTPNWTQTWVPGDERIFSILGEGGRVCKQVTGNGP